LLPSVVNLADDQPPMLVGHSFAAEKMSGGQLRADANSARRKIDSR
jgi:hypothetical protein